VVSLVYFCEECKEELQINKCYRYKGDMGDDK